MLRTKWEKTHIVNISNEIGNVIKDLIAIKKIREYYEQAYANKFSNLQEISKLIIKQTTKKVVNNMNSSICIKEIELVVKNSPPINL